MEKQRKKKGRELVNNTGIPQYAIERFARSVLDDIKADYENSEIQAEFLRWQAGQKSPGMTTSLCKGCCDRS